MNDFERELRHWGETAERELPGEMTPRPDALRRIRLRRRVLSGSLVLCTAVAVAGGVALSAGPGREVDRLRPAEEKSARDEDAGPDDVTRCGVSFEPTYLPPGLDPKARPASGGDEELPAESPYPVAHYRGPRGTFVDVRAGSGPSFVQTRPRPVVVLGTRASLGDVHEGYSVEFRVDRCRYELLAYGLERDELGAFAEGLVSTTERGPHFSSVWPEDTVSEARQECALHQSRRDPEAVARLFAEEMLRWVDPRPEVVDASRRDGSIEMTISYEDARTAGVEPGVRLWMEEALPDCWSVGSVSTLRERKATGLSVGVSGRTAEIYFDKLGATSATVEFGYGTHRSTTTWHPGDPDIVRLLVSGDRDETGHFLVLFRNAEGDPFTARGGPLPPGDFAAG
jgi:hypothetical protein